MLVIDADGVNRGNMRVEDARALAQEQELDLIEVSPLAQPPVCRIMELGKWQYEFAHKFKRQKKFETKIIRISFKIGEHDRQFKLNQARKFLEKGHKVRVELMLKGRERAYPEQGCEIVKKFIEDLRVEIIEEQPITKQINIISALIGKKSS